MFRPMHSLPTPDEQPGRHAVFIYVLGLSVVAVMALSVLILSDRMIIEHDRVATVVSQTSRLSVQVQKVLTAMHAYPAEPTEENRVALVTAVDDLANQHQDIVANTAKAQDDQAAAARAVDLIYFSDEDPLQPKLAGLIADSGSIARMSATTVRAHSDEITGKVNQYRGLSNDLDRAIHIYETKLQDRMSALQLWLRTAITVILVMILLETLLIFIPMMRKMNEYAATLRHIALSDTLTNIGNRRYFEARGAEEIQRARRHMRPLALCLIDVDHFKTINDTYGHLTGDKILTDVVACIQTALRTEDIISRVGGEEFSVLLPYADLRNAAHVAERIRKAVHTATFKTENGEPIVLTVSLGVTMVPVDSQNIDKSVDDADAALYEAKFRGRNLTVVNHQGQFLVVGSPLWDDFLKVLQTTTL
jgi:diguanylate cyclase (GGDEF)-like protein